MNNPYNSLYLSKPEEARAWLVDFHAIACSEKKSDKASDGTNHADLRRANFSISQGRVQAILKMRSLVSQWDPHCSMGSTL